jgi:signal transduction histidine kinase
LTDCRLARQLLLRGKMSSLENIYQKMTPALDPLSPGQSSRTAGWPEPTRQISREVAHDLNNILTIIQGYAERMIMKHGDNPALRPDLQLITENAKRAASVVRQATPRQVSNLPVR